MPIELARAQSVAKPWGVSNLRPWVNADHDDRSIGEVWYERSGSATPDPALLLKLLFASQPLSIQVHPDDTQALSMHLPRGKSEAWYVLSAAPGAKVALGLKQKQTSDQLRTAIGDGSIADLVAWQTVLAGDVISVPAGTIHAIGAGLVIAEIQQRSDATFRLFDHGRQRELHIESAIAVANTRPVRLRARPNRFSDERALLVSNYHFVLERIDLAPNSIWCLEAQRETWLLVLSGSADIESFEVAAGNAVFAQLDRVDIHTGATGMVGLVAYTGIGPLPHLLRCRTEGNARKTPTPSAQVPTSVLKARVAPASGREGTMK